MSSDTKRIRVSISLSLGVRWFIAAGLASTIVAAVGGEKRPMDTEHSRLTVVVGKSGFFSGLAHEHEISAPIAQGEVEFSSPASVAFTVHSGKLIVVDPGESDSTRAEIQKTMLGPTVLDADKFPEIRFVSENVERLGDTRWNVHGRLTLHGQTQAVVLETTLEKGHYQGTATLLQSDFGITPIRLAGGTIRVKNEVQVKYDIVLAGQ
jgi:polyisoprenoid-binding protein YceI